MTPCFDSVIEVSLNTFSIDSCWTESLQRRHRQGLNYRSVVSASSRTPWRRHPSFTQYFKTSLFNTQLNAAPCFLSDILIEDLPSLNIPQLNIQNKDYERNKSRAGTNGVPCLCHISDIIDAFTARRIERFTCNGISLIKQKKSSI